jgi:hypothetical protein
LAVASALAGQPIMASPTTASPEKKATFLLLRVQKDCRWTIVNVDVADRGKDFTTHRVASTLACLTNDPNQPINACLSRN